jgi:hypothetical protein
MLYLSDRTATRVGRELVATGKAKAFKVTFVRQRCPDTRQIEAGYKLILI